MNTPKSLLKRIKAKKINVRINDKEISLIPELVVYVVPDFMGDQQHNITSAAEKGNEYAKLLLNNDNYHAHSSVATVLASMRLLARLSQIIRDDTEKRSSTGRSIDRKLMRKIEEKKMAQGQKMG